MEKTTGTCRFCGKETTKAKTRGRPKVYCNTSCQRKWEYQQKKEQYKAAALKRYHDSLDEHRARGRYFSSLGMGNVVSDKVMSEKEVGYLAGLMDGEGTVSLVAESREENSMGLRFSPQMYVSNTELGILYQAREFAGNGKIHKVGTPKGLHRRVYKLYFNANQIRHILPQIKDTLAGKKKKCAGLLLEYLSLAEAGRHISEHMDRIKEIYRQLRILNFRGKATYLSPETINAKLSTLVERAGRTPTPVQ